jgi:hypothetical protein
MNGIQHGVNVFVAMHRHVVTGPREAVLDIMKSAVNLTNGRLGFFAKSHGLLSFVSICLFMFAANQRKRVTVADDYFIQSQSKHVHTLTAKFLFGGYYFQMVFWFMIDQF